VKFGASTKHFVLAFLLAAMCYALFYTGIENRRIRKGPWQVTFTTNATTGTPLLVINQPKLAITNVQINFLDEADVPADPVKMIFNEPRLVPYDVPFGKCIFMDTAFLPGTVTFKLFDREIELLPRVLIIDHHERAWSSGPFNLHRLATNATASQDDPGPTRVQPR
jgi:hypothetical protein